MRVVALDGSPRGGGRTEAALRAVLVAAEAAGAESALVGIEEQGVEAALEAAERADAFVLGTPVYRASYAAPLKAFLDRLPRGMWGETAAPVTARPVALVATGASWHHFLSTGDLGRIMTTFFAAHVLPPGLYVPHEGFDDSHHLTPPFLQQAELQGRALVELAAALERSDALRSLRPQA